MKVDIEHNTIIAQNEDDKLTLRIMFNCGIIRGAYIFWSEDNNKDHNEPWLQEYHPTAYIIVNKNNNLELPHTGQSMAKQRIEKSITETEEANKALAGDLFNFLK